VLRRSKEAELNAQPHRRDFTRSPALGTFLDQYFAHRENQVAAGTLELHRQTQRYLEAFFGKTRTLDSITRLDAQSFKAALSKNELGHVNKRPRKLRQATVEMHIRNARTIFNHAVRNDVLAVNPFDRLAATPAADREWHYVTPDEFVRLYHAASFDSWKLLIALARLAGLRRGEAIHLRWSNIDWRANRLNVVSTKHWRVKDREPRTIPICPELHAILLSAFEQARDNEQLVIPEGSINVKNIWRDSAVIRSRAKVEQYEKPLHTLRKSCITDWASRFPAHVVQEWAGHASIETTQRHYLKVSELEYQKAASSRMLAEVTQPWTQQAEKAANSEVGSRAQRRVNYDASTSYKNSGRSDSNRRRPAWEAGILPLNYARKRGFALLKQRLLST